MKVKSLSHVRVLATPRTVAHQAPPSMEFYRQKYWSGVPLSSLSNKYILEMSIRQVDVKHLKSDFSLLEWEIIDKQGEED